MTLETMLGQQSKRNRNILATGSTNTHIWLYGKYSKKYTELISAKLI